MKNSTLSKPVNPAATPRRGAEAAHREIDRDCAMAHATLVRRAFVARLSADHAAYPAMLTFALADTAANLDNETLISGEVAAAITPVGIPNEESRWPKPDDDVLDHRLVSVLFTLVAGAIESLWTDDIWQMPDERSVRYLTFLAEQGYRLSSIERRMSRSVEHDRSDHPSVGP